MCWWPDPQLLLCQGPDESFQLVFPWFVDPFPPPPRLLYGEPYQGPRPGARYRSADLDEREPTTAMRAINAPPAKHAPITIRIVIASPL